MRDRLVPPLPPTDLRFMNESDERFLAIGTQSAELLIEQGLGANDSILDVGCGYGRLAFGLLSELDFEGRYEGFDVLLRQIDWCRDAITPRFPNFRFVHLDTANARYNPGGSIVAAEVRFPYDDDTFDFCALISVFTHMYAVDIRHYMDEINRVLKPRGTCVATFFVFNEDRMDAVTSSGAALPMRYQLSEVCRYFNKDSILHAISYEENYVAGLWAEAGITVTDMKWGTWAGDQPRNTGDPEVLDLYQDVFTVRSHDA